MPDDDPDKLKRSAGVTLRHSHGQAKQSSARDRPAQVMQNKLAQRQSRWQRLVRYVWDRKRS